MLAFRFSRHDPRASNLGNWTAHSDIGQTFNGQLLSEEKYLRVESAYLEAISMLIDTMDVGSSTFTQVFYPTTSAADRSKIAENQKASPDTLIDAFRSGLREEVGFILSDAQGAYLFAGFDLYVHFGTATDIDDPRPRIRSLGLFPEDEAWILDN